MPGPGHAAEHRGEGMDGNDRRLDSALGESRDSVPDPAVIGPEDLGGAPEDILGVEISVARDLDAVASGDDRTLLVEPAVAVDDQARIPRYHRRCIELPRELPRHPGRTDVMGDVGGEIALAQTEPVKRRRDRIRGVIAHHDDRRGGVPIDDRNRGRIIGPEQAAGPVGTLVHGGTITKSALAASAPGGPPQAGAESPAGNRPMA